MVHATFLFKSLNYSLTSTLSIPLTASFSIVCDSVRILINPLVRGFGVGKTWQNNRHSGPPLVYYSQRWRHCWIPEWECCRARHTQWTDGEKGSLPLTGHYAGKLISDSLGRMIINVTHIVICQSIYCTCVNVSKYCGTKKNHYYLTL